MPQYHILNGDALGEQFPENSEVIIIVACECMVDGNVKGSTLGELFQTRAKFISGSYEGYTVEDYFDRVVPEFEKICTIEKGADINLWFEDDLFCQVNFWFVMSLLKSSNHSNPIFLVQPEEHNQSGFGELDKQELMSVYKNRLLLTEVERLSSLWEYYQNEDTGELLETAKELETKYSFILSAVEAHIDRIPTEGNLGRPSETLLQINERYRDK